MWKHLKFVIPSLFIVDVIIYLTIKAHGAVSLLILTIRSLVRFHFKVVNVFILLLKPFVNKDNLTLRSLVLFHQELKTCINYLSFARDFSFQI